MLAKPSANTWTPISITILGDTTAVGPFLIFEDDVKLKFNIRNLLIETKRHGLVPYDWHFLQLRLEKREANVKFHRMPFINSTISGGPQNNKTKLVKSTSHSSAYLVRNKEVIQSLINTSNTDYFQFADRTWNQLFLNKTLKCYAVKNVLANDFNIFSTDISRPKNNTKNI